MKKYLIVPLILAFAALSGGCATLAKVFTPSSAPYVQVAVDVAVASAVQKGVSAVQIKSVAQQVLAADTGTATTLSALEAVVNKQLSTMKLPSGDLAAAQLLMATLASVISVEVTNSSSAAAVTQQTQVAVAQVMNDVIVATAAYGA